MRKALARTRDGAHANLRAGVCTFETRVSVVSNVVPTVHACSNRFARGSRLSQDT